MLSFLFKSHLIRHSGTKPAFKDIQRALEHLRHSESTRDLGTRRALRGHSDTRALVGNSGTRKALGHSRTKALGH